MSVAGLLLLCGVMFFLSSSIRAQHTKMRKANTSDFSQQMTESMERMDRAMMEATMTGDADRDFAAMMIPHHQGAIDMARIQLTFGKDPVMRRLAQEIIITQQSEIEAMQRQLNKLNKPSQATIFTGSKVGNDASEIHQHTKSSNDATPIPVSGRDRIYTGDQTSNTVSVIDPSNYSV
jgi:hypothetical protein